MMFILRDREKRTFKLKEISQKNDDLNLSLSSKKLLFLQKNDRAFII